jgi:hypothetical protein
MPASPSDTIIDPSFSPSGQYQTTSVVHDELDGTLSVVTRIAETKTDRTKNVIKWKHPGGLGSLGLGGEWLTDDQFLIYQALDIGPMLIRTDGDITQIAPELFGLPAEPQEAAKWFVEGGIISGASRYHLVLLGSNTDAGEPVVRFYHSETGEVEMVPFPATWGPFSPNGKWLLLDKRPTVEGHESYEVWFRPVDPVGSPVRRLAGGFTLNLLWSPDWAKVASTAWNSPDPYASRPSVVQVLSFPEVTQLGSWKSEDYSMTPLAWSPDGRFLVVRGYVVGIQREALFVISVL